MNEGNIMNKISDNKNTLRLTASRQKFFAISGTLFLALSLPLVGLADPPAAPAPPTTTNVAANTGTQTNTQVNSSGSINNAGIGVIGDINGNLNSLSTGSNYVSPTIYTPSNGGSSALVLPRNPLSMALPQ